MHRFFALFLAAGLTACTTVDEVQKQPVRITMTVPAAWDRTGACLASAYNSYETLYLPVASEQRAEIIVNMVTTGLLGSIKRTMFVFDIRGGNPTTVIWRRDTYLHDSFEQEARERIERCGKV